MERDSQICKMLRREKRHHQLHIWLRGRSSSLERTQSSIFNSSLQFTIWHFDTLAIFRSCCIVPVLLAKTLPLLHPYPYISHLFLLSLSFLLPFFAVIIYKILKTVEDCILMTKQHYFWAHLTRSHKIKQYFFINLRNIWANGAEI